MVQRECITRSTVTPNCTVAPELRGARAAVSRLLLVVRRRTDPVLMAQLVDFHARIRLLQDGHDLRLRESRFLHQNLLRKYARKLYF